MTALVVAVWLFLSARSALAAERPPYLGEWSNGRGETLTITRKTLRFADNKPVPYRDVTTASDEGTFELLITAPGEVNAFPGKTVGLECNGAAMTMTTYASHADYVARQNSLSRVQWYKDEPVAEGPGKERSYTPAPGSSERKAIALALHPHCERELKQDVVLKFDRLVVSGAWAIATFRPLQPNGESIDFRASKFTEQVEAGAFDPAGEALLRKERGRWRVVEWRFGNTDTALAEWQAKHRLPATLLE